VLSIPTATAQGVNSARGALPKSTAPGWAGYIVRAAGRAFTEVRGSWREPQVVCNRPQSSAAFWVGIGGAERDSSALEQIGTSADCSSSALPSHSAWYELVPAAPIDIPIVIEPGDLVSARLSLRGLAAHVELRNRSTGASFATTDLASSVETGSAEWIAEAPAACLTPDCTPLPLADFARVTFTQTWASAGAPLSSIATRAWAAQAVTMRPPGRALSVVPTQLSRDSASFTLYPLSGAGNRRIVRR
jgi:hypothetical protein